MGDHGHPAQFQSGRQGLMALWIAKKLGLGPDTNRKGAHSRRIVALGLMAALVGLPRCSRTDQEVDTSSGEGALAAHQNIQCNLGTFAISKCYLQRDGLDVS